MGLADVCSTTCPSCQRNQHNYPSTAYKVLSHSKVRLDGFVKEVDVKLVHYVHKVQVDVLKRLRLGLEGSHQLRLRIEELLRKKGTAH